MGIKPFRDGDVFGTFRNLLEKLENEIQSLDNEYVLKVSQTELENHYIDKVTIKPLILHTEKHYIEGQ